MADNLALAAIPPVPNLYLAPEVTMEEELEEDRRPDGRPGIKTKAYTVVTPAQWRAYTALTTLPPSALLKGPGEALARALGCRGQVARRHLQALEAAGLVERIPGKKSLKAWSFAEGKINRPLTPLDEYEENYEKEPLLSLHAAPLSTPPTLHPQDRTLVFEADDPKKPPDRPPLPPDGPNNLGAILGTNPWGSETSSLNDYGRLRPSCPGGGGSHVLAAVRNHSHGEEIVTVPLPSRSSSTARASSHPSPALGGVVEDDLSATRGESPLCTFKGTRLARRMGVMSLSKKMMMVQVSANKGGRPRLSKRDVAFSKVYEQQRQEVQPEFKVQTATLSTMAQARLGLDRLLIPEFLWGSFLRWASDYFYKVTDGRVAFPPLRALKSTEENYGVKYLTEEGWRSHPPTDDEIVEIARSHGRTLEGLQPRFLRHVLLPIVGDMMAKRVTYLPVNFPDSSTPLLRAIYTRAFRCRNEAFGKSPQLDAIQRGLVHALRVPEQPEEVWVEPFFR